MMRLEVLALLPLPSKNVSKFGDTIRYSEVRCPLVTRVMASDVGDVISSSQKSILCATHLKLLSL